MTQRQKAIIICVDDEKMILDSLEDQILHRLGQEVECEVVEGGEEALELIDEYLAFDREIAVIISDQVMPGMKGDEFLIQAHKKLPDTLKILLTGQSGLEAVRNAINNARLYRYFTKPWQEEDLMLTLEEAVRSFRQNEQLKEYNLYTRLLRLLNRAAHEISSEINLNELVDKFLRIAIDCTDAYRGILILRSEEGLKIEAVASAGQQKAERFKTYENNYVQQLTSDFLANIEVLIDFEVPNPRQIASRIKHKDTEWGYIYLEKDLKGKSFSGYHYEMLGMLSTQAAIAIENSNLYSRLNEQKENIERIKQIVEQKNEDITDSIKYAQRIQQTHLSDLLILNQHFRESFVLFKPRDIVSGDFYWWRLHDDRLILACADCTGHGVPGAIMSIIGSNFLEQIVNEYDMTDPASILMTLDQKVRNALQQNVQGSTTNDGMDVALISYDFEKKIVDFSGANRPIYLLRDDACYEYHPNKMSIGGNEKFRLENILTNQTIQLQEGDLLYLFSDGITDQFGGSSVPARKFSAKRLKETLFQVKDLPLSDQRALIDVLLEEWRGNTEQTDDMLLIGLRI